MLIDAVTSPARIFRTAVIATNAESGTLGGEINIETTGAASGSPIDFRRLLRMVIGEPASSLEPEMYAATVRRPDPFGVSVLQRTMRHIARLALLGDNWDGFGSPAPRERALSHARQLAIAVLSNVEGMTQQMPLISADENGDVVLEWASGGPRRLSVFIGPDRAEFVKSWGNNIHSEMETGVIAGAPSLSNLLDWFAQG